MSKTSEAERIVTTDAPKSRSASLAPQSHIGPLSRVLVRLVAVAIIASSASGCFSVRGRSGGGLWRVGLGLPIPSGSTSKGLHCRFDEKIAKVDGKIRCVPKSPSPAPETPESEEDSDPGADEKSSPEG